MEEKNQNSRVVGASDADIIGMTEVGRNEDLMSHQTRPSTIVKKMDKNGQATVDWNRRGSSAYEPGGTMSLMKERARAHTIRKGKDERRLGRWTWVSIKGKENKTESQPSLLFTELQMNKQHHRINLPLSDRSIPQNNRRTSGTRTLRNLTKKNNSGRGNHTRRLQ